MLAFLQKYRIKLILGFAVAYPFIIGYLWYLLHLGTIVKDLTGAYPADPLSQFFVMFFPAVIALFLLPIRPFPYRFASVIAIALTYMTFMTWPVLAFRHASYCAIHHIECIPY
jgi:hypothetical protein